MPVRVTSQRTFRWLHPRQATRERIRVLPLLVPSPSDPEFRVGRGPPVLAMGLNGKEAKEEFTAVEKKEQNCLCTQCSISFGTPLPRVNPTISEWT